MPDMGVLRAVGRVVWRGLLIASPFVVPFYVESAGLRAEQGALSAVRWLNYRTREFGVLGCGLGAGLLLLALAFRRYAIGIALVYLPVMYVLLLFWAVGLQGGF